MPEPLIRRALLPIAALLFASSLGAGARAFEGESQACVAGLRITVGPETLEPARARRMLDEIVSELGPQRGAGDATCADGATRIDVEVGEAETRVVIEGQKGAERRRIERAVDVSEIAEDGRPLAVAIVVDEMAREVNEQLTIRPTPPAPAPPPPSPPRPPLARPVTSPRGYFGPALGLDFFTTGVTLLGVDAKGDLLLGKNLALGARAGPRGALVWDGGTHEAWVAGGSLAVSPDVRAPWGISGVFGVDAFVALAGSHARAAATVAPSLGGRAWAALGRGFQLTLDARIGLPLTSLRAPQQDGRAATDAGGVVVTTSLAVVVVF